MSALTRLYNTYKQNGVAAAWLKIFLYILKATKGLNWPSSLRALHRKIELSSRAYVFKFIDNKEIWLSKESKSGYGSTLDYTETARKQIQIIINEYSLRSIYDAPCGDFNWMRLVVSSSQVAYLGADIVPALIERNKASYQAPNVRFEVRDIVVDPFPDADLWICRDCFIHFSISDILKTLDNFCASSIEYILTTNYLDDSGSAKNSDISTGDFRPIYLFTEPFNFAPSDVKYRFLDYVEPHLPREMILLRREDVARQLVVIREQLALVSDNSTT